ncbi:MAG: hypothetical protein IJ207_11160 [Treponema sp.]|uniref:hypothetical protein n=1 Tax=Treponema sp. TaxID=166 RepID=UPI0025E7611E|nr:hypothetical protein [Treponema sp.]MBQ9282732.1 hypothetical protein [Treponema sp.]
MKKNFKFVLAAVSLLAAFCLTSCSNSDDDDSSSSVVATYKRTEDPKWAKIFLYADGTASKAVQEALEDYGIKDGIIKTGTFVKEGDTYKDCTITITWKKILQQDLQWHDVADTDEEKEQTFTFVDGTSSSGWIYQSE